MVMPSLKGQCYEIFCLIFFMNHRWQKAPPNSKSELKIYFMLQIHVYTLHNYEDLSLHGWGGGGGGGGG